MTADKIVFHLKFTHCHVFSGNLHVQYCFLVHALQPSFPFGFMPDRELENGICLPVRLYPNAKFENKEQQSNYHLE